MKKRIISIILVFILAVSLLGTAAFAAPAQTMCINGSNDKVTCIEDTNKLGSGKIIFYPDELEASEEQYPLIVWANGTGCITQTYYPLLQKFAAAGYVIVADTTVMSADGTAQVNSVDYAIAKNADESSVLCGKIDTDSIAAAGHSQGGRSAVNAAALDSRIDCVLSIAGSSYKSEAAAVSCPVFFMTGTADLIVLSSMWVKPAYENVQGNAVYASLKGGVHTTCMVTPSKVAGYGIAWFDAQLKGDDSAAAVFAPGGALASDSAWKYFACK